MHIDIGFLTTVTFCVQALCDEQPQVGTELISSGENAMVCNVPTTQCSMFLLQCIDNASARKEWNVEVPVSDTPGTVVYSGVSFVSWFSAQKCLEFLDLELVLNAVTKCAPNEWYSIAVELGFSEGEIEAKTTVIPSAKGKLQKMVRVKAAAFGRQRTARLLLKACESIPNPVIGAVNEILQQLYQR